jgi:hypothetical protein
VSARTGRVRVEVDRSPCPDLCDWLRVHGLRPDLIPIWSVLEIDFDARRIGYDQLRTHSDGPPALGRPLVFDRVVAQLEAAPLPVPDCPDLILTWVTPGAA